MRKAERAVSWVLKWSHSGVGKERSQVMATPQRPESGAAERTLAAASNYNSVNYKLEQTFA